MDPRQESSAPHTAAPEHVTGAALADLLASLVAIGRSMQEEFDPQRFLDQFSDQLQHLIPHDRLVIDLVDEAGYVPADLSHIAEQLGASATDVESVLAVVQKFDPPGICARSLSECPKSRSDSSSRAAASAISLRCSSKSFLPRTAMR